MADQAKLGVHLGFFSKSLKGDPHPLGLVGVDGREELSQLFTYELLLFRAGDPLTEKNLIDLVRDPCVIALGNHKTDVVHGVLSSIEHVAGARDEGQYYRAEMRPTASMLHRGKRSAIYQDTTVPDMVTAILASYGLTKSTDFDIHNDNAKKSPKHEYIVQYEESDWDFIQRWLEHEGFFYWFTHSVDGVGLVIADSNHPATPIDDPHAIGYRGESNLDTTKDSIWSFRVRHTRVPTAVTLVDYNYRRPLDMLISSQPVDKDGFGHVFHYGDHFKETGVGKAWAELRSEELVARRRVVSGWTDCARLRVGHTFDLENHYFGEYDKKYLVVSMDHEAGLSTKDSGDDFLKGVGTERPYRAHFTAIPFDIAYRPARRTHWPRIDGVINAHIEEDTAGDYAQIDDEGRYKVKFPFDVGTKKGLASSRWIRMAQAYAGSSYGQHFPLHKGAEVLIAHIDGNPDRPVIVGAVPNPATPSPVIKGNATQSVMQTASGIRVEREDLQG